MLSVNGRERESTEVIIADPLGLWAHVLRGAWILTSAGLLMSQITWRKVIPVLVLGFNFSVYIMGAVIPPTHSWEEEEPCGGRVPLQGVVPLLAIWSLVLCPPGPSHHAELGLQLNLQALEHPPELIQLIVALLHQLAVKGRFFVQLLRLR